jgi:site-specific DNA-cytosine methylase
MTIITPARRPIGMSICSGIGAPECAAPWIDWKYQAEIEPFPSAVLKHRFPHAVNLGDITKFKEWPDATIDVLAGGTEPAVLRLHRDSGTIQAKMALI